MATLDIKPHHNRVRAKRPPRFTITENHGKLRINAAYSRLDERPTEHPKPHLYLHETHPDASIKAGIALVFGNPNRNPGIRLHTNAGGYRGCSSQLERELARIFALQPGYTLAAFGIDTSDPFEVDGMTFHPITYEPPQE